MQKTYVPASNNTNGSLGLEAPGQSAQLFTYNLFGGMTGATANGHTANYTYNGHGDVVKVGAQTYSYDAFGNQLNPNQSDTNPFRYAGEYWDGESGQVYVGTVW